VRIHFDIKLLCRTIILVKARGNPTNLTRAGMGRPKGIANKATRALKQMILGALNQAGGDAYLLSQTQIKPVAFTTLIGKVLPSEIQAQLTGLLIVQALELIVQKEQVNQIRQQRAQAKAKQAQMDQLNQASQTAKNLGQTPTNGHNAMTDVINMFSGYNSPSPMQV
jgi:hypothetical protein